MVTKVSQKAKTATVFIDGEAGTTGLEIRERLAAIRSVNVKSIDPGLRKDKAARADMMRDVDLTVLCLPDDAAREAVALADTLGADAPKIIDASTAHRIAPGWVYGFAEMAPGQADAIRGATRVANPGCYPTGGIALIRPLVEAGIMPADYPVTVNAVSGYSGGGRSMIEAYEAGSAPSFELYGLGLEHKHVPELHKYSGLVRRPIFVPSVGNYHKGMLVSVPLHLDTLTGNPSVADIEAVLANYYKTAELVSVVTGSAGKIARLETEALNDTDRLELFVFGKPELKQAVLVARLDNLGKGAAGAAVQNIKLMLGLN
ncbi:N-acetyl-gamma-glutamyl-phosphate reductase [Hyphomicrobium denitrificans 1NES1]|uniref:N-acetyl-gamma-glutamyl-phosphate reductase n=1 Tax=Hyphomicrobium denitrificans 1NES1 TaxID=670307 RepID=N0BC04_9HYPH|nr:N-acetyl-gamma-glutamyl-phosphate reductase [Hyphomicrobium denitrificans]AGK58026.1 N-acetyl-gamma-glutamyl-phosphate reductase [Hyphomicrobium denitrificans 1NES1]